MPLATCGAAIARMRSAAALRLCQLRWSARTWPHCCGRPTAGQSIQPNPFRNFVVPRGRAGLAGCVAGQAWLRGALGCVVAVPTPGGGASCCSAAWLRKVCSRNRARFQIPKNFGVLLSCTDNVVAKWVTKNSSNNASLRRTPPSDNIASPRPKPPAAQWAAAILVWRGN
jgi:hypothetical protein